MRYSVGMLVKYRRRQNCVCVIRGWEIECDEWESRAIELYIDMSERKKDQPFYYVLENGGRSRLV